MRFAAIGKLFVSPLFGMGVASRQVYRHKVVEILLAWINTVPYEGLVGGTCC